MQQNNLEIRPLHTSELEALWQLAFSDSHAEWTKWNGPYFHDVLPTKQAFLTTIGPKEWLSNKYRWIITFNDELVGALFAYYDDGSLKRWLDVGITVYRTDLWGQHIGQRALKLWITHLFDEVIDLPHIGLTTWSGNLRMINLSKKIGLHLEGKIRQVRYWQGKYYDSVKHGILRSEWF
ncbi:GNAT family N-acetyltransferase [Pediococcus cellicola]|uniref:Acetyltransferase, GNAT family n=1 Tax=Pediococcus cellicola TaxID=319652 RepID=A0A0R2IMP4_9LACO|nr:GNAT family protein [Pediococcus cellicola]KRN66235.1 acetyltransferase, GNAT family [Pediococcus cellicola]GEL15196.1 N-acetyltransferase [Pediococcus cellicola]